MTSPPSAGLDSRQAGERPSVGGGRINAIRDQVTDSMLVQLARSQALPETPDLDVYHRAARAAAGKVQVTARSHLIAFLTAMAEHADLTAALRERRSRTSGRCI